MPIATRNNAKAKYVQKYDVVVYNKCNICMYITHQGILCNGVCIHVMYMYIRNCATLHQFPQAVGQHVAQIIHSIGPTLSVLTSTFCPCINKCRQLDKRPLHSDTPHSVGSPGLQVQPIRLVTRRRSLAATH